MLYQHPSGHRVTIAGHPVAAPGVAFTGHESAADMALFGYVPVIEPPSDPMPSTPLVFSISKLALRRALRAANLESVFNQALSSNPQWAADWADAQELRSDDPLLLEALPQLASLANLSEEQAMDLLRSASI